MARFERSPWGRPKRSYWLADLSHQTRDDQAHRQDKETHGKPLAQPYTPFFVHHQTIHRRNSMTRRQIAALLIEKIIIACLLAALAVWAYKQGYHL